MKEKRIMIKEKRKNGWKEKRIGQLRTRKKE
jgi:hypothetical protein